MLAAAMAGCRNTRWDWWRAEQSAAPEPNLPAQVAGETSDPDPGLLKAMLDRPPVPVTEPEGGVVEPKPRAPAEPGEMIVNRLCKIERNAETGWILLRFPGEAGRRREPPRWALPSRLLEKMEQIDAGAPDRVFRVSGETTVYDARAFLLLRKVVVITPHDRPAGERTIRPVPQPAPPDETPTTTAAADDGADEDVPSAEQVSAELVADKPGEPVVLETGAPDASADAAESVAPDEGREVLPAGRGEMVVDRIVRVVATGAGNWMKVTFTSDNTLQEPPMRLLPCRLLSVAEQSVQSSPFSRTRFRVSGEITHYRGRRYLLLRKLIREREMGQF